MPMPLSATASSTQSRPSATLRTRRATSPSFVNLHALLKRLSRFCLIRMESVVSAPRFSCASTTRRLLFFSASCPAVPTNLIDETCQMNRLGIEFELAGFDLREVEYLVDEAQEVGAGGIHTAQRFQRLFGAEARRVGDHHFGQADDGVERRAQLVAHTGEELRLALARLRQLSALVLDFVEQPHILDGDHRLVCEGLHQLDLLVGEWTHGTTKQGDDADRRPFPDERYAKHGAITSYLLALGIAVFRVRQDIGDVKDAAS